MSWYEDEPHSLEIRAAGTLEISFTCPRCGKRQIHKVDGMAVVDGTTIYCNNSGECGHRETIIDLRLSIEAMHKGLSDEPLKKS